jgi:hypothetical protein
VFVSEVTQPELSDTAIKMSSHSSSSSNSSSSSEVKVGGTGSVGGWTGALPTITKQVLIRASPKGEPTEADFDIKDVPIPQLKTGQFLVRIHYLSVSY